MCIISMYRNGTVNYNSKKLASESETRILTASDVGQLNHIFSDLLRFVLGRAGMLGSVQVGL